MLSLVNRADNSSGKAWGPFDILHLIYLFFNFQPHPAPFNFENPASKMERLIGQNKNIAGIYLC